MRRSTLLCPQEETRILWLLSSTRDRVRSEATAASCQANLYNSDKSSGQLTCKSSLWKHIGTIVYIGTIYISACVFGFVFIRSIVEWHGFLLPNHDSIVNDEAVHVTYVWTQHLPASTWQQFSSTWQISVRFSSLWMKLSTTTRTFPSAGPSTRKCSRPLLRTRHGVALTSCVLLAKLNIKEIYFCGCQTQRRVVRFGTDDETLERFENYMNIFEDELLDGRIFPAFTDQVCLPTACTSATVLVHCALL